MVEPTGYTALDLIGFTDRGNYDPATNYVKNDLVHYGGSIWRILIDDTIGQTPQEGLYYTVFVKEPTNMVERIMAPLEQNPATQAWTVGRQIINNDYLYEVIAPIAIGDNLVAYEDDPTNANIKLAPPIETQVLAIKNEADMTEDMIAPAESNPAAAFHSVGTQIIVDNILYDVTSPIAANDALVAYPTTGYNIKPAASVSSQIQALANNKVNTSDVVNNLTTTTEGKVLDARAGKTLADITKNKYILQEYKTISVTADGTKTTSTLLQELINAASDWTLANMVSTDFIVLDKLIVGPIAAVPSQAFVRVRNFNYCEFNYSFTKASGETQIVCVECSRTTGVFCRATWSSTGVYATYDISSNKPSNGTVYSLSFLVYKYVA